MKIKQLLKEPRVLLMIILVILAIVAIKPSYTYDPVTKKAKIETNLQFGLDVSGGIRAMLEPESQNSEVIDRAISVLNTRLNAFGLKEVRITKINVEKKTYVQIEMSGYDIETLEDLLQQQGRFEAKIPRPVEIKDGKGTLYFNGHEYPVAVINATAIEMPVNGSPTIINLNETFTLEDVIMELRKVSNESVVFAALVYESSGEHSDIKKVYRDVEHARVVPAEGGGYKFKFAVATTKESAERFAKVTKDLREMLVPGQRCYLDQKIELYVDGKLLDTLNIDCDLKGSVLTQPWVSGYNETKANAIKEMAWLQSILESGALPTKMTVVNVSEISPTLGELFVRAALLSILIAILGVGVIVLIRYRRIEITAAIMTTLLAELVLILGFASAVKWNLDLPSIAGILAIIGSGVDHQIIITDESLHRRGKREELSLKQKLKRAFQIIFTAAATLTAAMLPIFFIAGIAASMKGFAFTTIVGVWIGVMITRPTYSKIVEYILRE